MNPILIIFFQKDPTSLQVVVGILKIVIPFIFRETRVNFCDEF